MLYLSVMKEWVKQKQQGFTIVELLIVVVVIAILAAITIVAYNGIQNRANDTAVQSDLRAFGVKIEQYVAEKDALPTLTQLSTLGLKASKGSYGAHYDPGSTNGYNLLYCMRTSDKAFAVIGASKSGNVFSYNAGSVKQGTTALRTYTGTCADYGVSSASPEWLFVNGVWMSWL